MNQMRKNRVNVTFSPVQHDQEEEQEELNHIQSQRQLFKHFKSSTTFSSIAKEDIDESADSETIIRVENEYTDQSDSGFVFESEDYTIWIEDFDFSDHMVTAYVGDTVSFVLSPTVPLHAEHMIYGTSDIPTLNFESDIMQVIVGSCIVFYVRFLLIYFNCTVPIFTNR